MNNKIKKVRTFFILTIIILLIVSVSFYLYSQSQKPLIDELNDENISWIALKKQDGELRLTFDYLIHHKCVIKEVRYGINQSMPNNILVLPTCNGDIKKIETYRTLPPSATSISIYLILNNGRETNLKEYYID